MDYVSLGPVPCDEDCAQVGSEDYHIRARAECKRFIELIRRICGNEVGTARLKITSNPHDFGTYLDVVCTFSDDIGCEYAYRIEDNAPRTWEGAVCGGSNEQSDMHSNNTIKE